MHRVLRCYAEGRDRRWEAICLDLDIAVQGDSFEAVYHDLEAALSNYLAYVATLPESERPPLLDRQVPWSLQVKFLWHAIKWTLLRLNSGGKTRAEFLVPVAA